MRRTRWATAALALAMAGSLAACGDDAEGKDEDGPQTVELGGAFSYDGFEVADGWKVGSQEVTAGTDAVVMPYIEGATATNTRDEERFVLFELVFAADGQAVSTIKCNSRAKLAEGESATLVCLGQGQPVPEEYDRIVVQPITR